MLCDALFPPPRCALGPSCRYQLLGALFVLVRAPGPALRLGVCLLGFPAVICAVKPIHTIASLCNIRQWSSHHTCWQPLNPCSFLCGIHTHTPADTPACGQAGSFSMSASYELALASWLWMCRIRECVKCIDHLCTEFKSFETAVLRATCGASS